jgi:hypothetical protein
MADALRAPQKLALKAVNSDPSATVHHKTLAKLIELGLIKRNKSGLFLTKKGEKALAGLPEDKPKKKAAPKGSPAKKAPKKASKPKKELANADSEDDDTSNEEE